MASTVDLHRSSSWNRILAKISKVCAIRTEELG
jgi:hypothetical protein